MDPQEIKDNDWELSIDSKVKVYITKEYKTNHDALKVIADREPDSVSRNYKDLESKESSNEMNKVRKWFNMIVFAKDEQREQYYDLFIKEGYDTLEGIAWMTRDDLRDIGVEKKGHISKLLRAIDKLKREQSYTPSNISAAHKFDIGSAQSPWSDINNNTPHHPSINTFTSNSNGVLSPQSNVENEYENPFE